MPIHALLVADDFETLAAAAAHFQSPRSRFQPVTLTVAHTWQAARVRIVLEAFDVIIVGHRVSDASALEMLTALQGEYASVLAALLLRRQTRAALPAHASA
jgi:hypothetical protein